MRINVPPSGNLCHHVPVRRPEAMGGKDCSEYIRVSDHAKRMMQGRCAKAMEEAMAAIDGLSSWELEQLQMHCGDANFERMRRYALDADFALLYQGLAAIPAGPQGPSAARMNACRIVEETRQANVGTWHWAGPKLDALREKIHRDGGTAEMIETQAFIGEQNASRAASLQHESDVAYENSKEAARFYNQQIRDQTSRQLLNENIAAQEQARQQARQDICEFNETLYSETITPGVMLTQRSAPQWPAVGPGTPGAGDAAEATPLASADRAPREGDTTTKTVALQPPQTSYHTATERRYGARPFAGTGSSDRVFHIDRVSTNAQGDQITHGHVMERKRLDTRQSVQNKAKQPRLTYRQLDFRPAGAASLKGPPPQPGTTAASGNSDANWQLSPWSTSGMMDALPRPALSTMAQGAPLPAPPPHPLSGSMPAASLQACALRVSRESRDGFMKRLDRVQPTGEWRKERTRAETQLPLLDPSIAKPVRKIISAMKKLLPDALSSSAGRAGQARVSRAGFSAVPRAVRTAQATTSTASCDSGSDSSSDIVIIGSEEAAWDSTQNALRAMAMQSMTRLSPVDLAALTDDPSYADPARRGASPKDFEAVSDMLAHMCLTRGEEASPDLLAVRNLFIAGTLDHAGNVGCSDASDDADVWKYKHLFKGWKKVRPGAREACTLFILKYEELSAAIAPPESKPAKGTQKYKPVESYHVSLWDSMTPEMRHTIGGVAQFSELLGLSTYTMRYRLSRSHGIPLAGERPYTGNTAAYKLLLNKWMAMSGRERRNIGGLGGFARQHGEDYQTLRSNLWHFQAEAAERLQARPAPPAQAGSADSTLPEAGLQPKIEADGEDWETVEMINPQPYDNACFYLSDPSDSKRSMTPQTLRRGKLDPLIYQQVMQWIADEGPTAAARMNALMEVDVPLDEGPERGESVFARQDIEQGTVIGIYAGKLLRISDGSYDAECRKYGACAIDAYAFDVEDDDVVLSGYQASNILSKINSAHPDKSVPQAAQWQHRDNNLCAVPAGRHMVCMVTIRTIRKGEELLLDYGGRYKIAGHQPIAVKMEVASDVTPVLELEGARIKGSRKVRGKVDIVPTELPFLGLAPRGFNTSHVLHHPGAGWYALEKKPNASQALPERYAYLAPQIVRDAQQYYFYYARRQVYLPVAPGAISTQWKVHTPDGDDTGHVLRYDAEGGLWRYGDLVLRGEESA
ncbi:MAG: hypothetical protein JWQ10_3071 [Herbaspirillum sp.]|nr:hypothetical protein [Herbaspirillum sp.]